jgi:ribokinase
VVVGSLNADLVARVARLPAAGETVAGRELAVFPGGKGANQAVAAARLGAPVRMVGRVGDDENGRRLRQSLDAAGVDTGGVCVDAGAPTGAALIATDDAGRNQIVVVQGANGRVSPADVERERQAFAGAGFVLVQLEIPLDAVAAALRLGRAAGALAILDPAPAGPEARGLLGSADYVTPNESELAALAETAGSGESEQALAGRLVELGARRVVAKLGARGALLVTRGGVRRWPAFAVAAVDTTAAGDAWNGAFAAALGAGADEDAAGRFACAAAALSVTRAGAQPSLPRRAEVEALLARGEGG